MVDKKLTKEEIILAVKAKRTNVDGAIDNSYISEQAVSIIKRIPGLDVDDLVTWWQKHPNLGTIAGGHVLQYLEEHDKNA